MKKVFFYCNYFKYQFYDLSPNFMVVIFDIAFNITDMMYKGMYNHKVKHEPDTDIILKRAKEKDIVPFFIGSNYQSSLECIEFAKTYNTFCYVGIHPNNATEDRNDIEKIKNLIVNNKCINQKAKNDDYDKVISSQKFYNNQIINNILAVGECGLDYYRKTSTPTDQKFVFKELLDLNYKNYFLHNRNSFRDFVEIVSDYKINGVVHSFDGTLQEAQELIKMGFYIGINGCSLKTEENVDVVKNLDIDRILIETDSPYCRIAKSYYGYNFLKNEAIIETNKTKKYSYDKVWKGKNEPITITEVLNVLSCLKNINIEELTSILYKNTVDCFGNDVIY